ncbi:hypothetical protein K439DRAFT_1381509 [Ramaria rubella]|nr:hypothetical protein K439DRAFT_1381509 [Ramaria rubella]
MSVETRPAKRSRDDDSENIQRSDSLYFTDGDIVLLSLPREEVVTAFKVDRVFLSRSSPVFHGMLSLPLPENVEKFDNVPLVRLQDKVEDLISFLKALYDFSTIPTKRNDRHTVSKVAGILRLATKYEVDNLRGLIITILSTDWPSDLASWDKNEAEIAEMSQPLDYPMDLYLPEPCEVILLAYECSVPELLPAAFYHLSRIPSFMDFTDDQDFSSDEFRLNISKGGRTAAYFLLSSRDLLRLMKGRDAISNFFFFRCRDVNNSEALRAQCTQQDPRKREACWESLMTYLHLDAHTTYWTCLDPLTRLRRCAASEVSCSICKYRFHAHLQGIREELWDTLPKFFRLDGN